MTWAHLTVIATGLLYVGASMALGVVVRLLGPTYHTKVTAPLWIVVFFALAAVSLLWRGVTLLFPGELVDTDRISLVAPLTAVVVVGLCLFVLDYVMGDRSPPPLFNQWFSWALKRRVTEDGIVHAAFALPPAMHEAAPCGAQINRTGRGLRLAVLSGGAATILIVLGVIAVNATG